MDLFYSCVGVARRRHRNYINPKGVVKMRDVQIPDFFEKSGI